MTGPIRLAFGALAVVLGLGVASGALARPQDEDFSLGKNAESQSCRAVARYDAPKGARAADIYCGAWERPSGKITVFANESSAQAALAELCKGTEAPLQSQDFTQLRQIACGEADKSGLRRYAMVADRGASVAIGEVYPSDWAPLINAARALTGATAPTAVSSSDLGQTPGLREIQAVFPAGPPGQTAALNYELLRRRAYEYNSMWEFGASLRDFEELLQSQMRIAPDDKTGEAETLAEIGLNMSSARRFDEATETLKRAEDLARSADDRLLVSKILNYRAIDALNQRHLNSALQLALQANQARASLSQSGQSGDTSINASDVSRVESQAGSLSQHTLLISLSEARPADKAAILNAQGDYIAGVAAREMGLASAAGYLRDASTAMQQSGSPPARLVADVAGERANLSLAAKDYAGAVEAAESGLAIIRTVAPGTRSEAHLWLTLEAAQEGLGRTTDALASGRAAIDLYAKQTESPGLPPDVAGPHLALLEQQWRHSSDTNLAEEYFRTLSLVWDGAAARTTALLAARLSLRDSGGSARIYQDAERAYRAAYARRQQLAGDPDAAADQLASQDAAVRKTATDLANAEFDLRSRAPTYLELLSPQASVIDLRSVLAPHEAYLRLVMTADGGFGALIDADGVHPFQIALTGAEVDALVDRLRRSTHLHGRRLPDYDIEAASSLYTALIGPVKDKLADVQDLDLDVGGSLASIPFAALVATPPTADQLSQIRSKQDYSGVDWLARHFTIENALGPASFVRLRRQQPPPTAQLSAVAYGAFEPNPAEVASRVAAAEGLSSTCRTEMERSLATMDALPETADEARSVAANFSKTGIALGPDFSDEAFTHDPATANADVILLATHGVLALSPCFPEPALLTSVGPHGLGLIEASAILDQQLQARLVLLSACDTAAGDKLDAARTGLDDGGDALSGLARAFIYAGARAVLASEWKVDSDASEAEIAHLLASAVRPGQTIRRALAESESNVYNQPETGHPFYWAAFILIGDGGGSLSGSASVADAR